jgi:hypothetical protein
LTVELLCGENKFKQREPVMKKLHVALLVTAAICFAAHGVAMAGTYLTPTIDGNGSEWSGVPIAINDGVDAGATIDIATVQIANDDSNLYFHVTFQTAVNPQSGAGTFVAIDTDNNTATGYDIFGLGAIGSEYGLQNDFPFEQTNGVFNTGGGVTGGAASIAVYNTTTNEQEYAISRSATFTASGNPVFTSNTIGVAFYSTDGAGDFAGTAVYTFAAVPEPSTWVLVGIGCLALPFLRRGLGRRRPS